MFRWALASLSRARLAPRHKWNGDVDPNESVVSVSEKPVVKPDVGFLTGSEKIDPGQIRTLSLRYALFRSIKREASRANLLIVAFSRVDPELLVVGGFGQCGALTQNVQFACSDASNGAQSLLSDGQFRLQPQLLGLHRCQACFCLSQVGNLRELKAERL